jgi:DEAD/DEAH box helicase domain-containing protein
MRVEAKADGDEFFHITDRDAMQEDPPDILLTMLDYLLLRPNDQRIWRWPRGSRECWLAQEKT